MEENNVWQPLVQRKLKIALPAKGYGLVSSFPMGINITEVLELNNMTIKRKTSNKTPDFSKHVSVSSSVKRGH